MKEYMRLIKSAKRLVISSEQTDPVTMLKIHKQRLKANKINEDRLAYTKLFDEMHCEFVVKTGLQMTQRNYLDCLLSYRKSLTGRSIT